MVPTLAATIAKRKQFCSVDFNGRRENDYGPRELPMVTPGRMAKTTGRRIRSYIAAFAVFVDLAGLLATAVNEHGPTRMILGLALALFLPGLAIIPPLRLAQPILEFSLIIAVSLATNLVVAQVLLSVHEWHLVAFQEVLSLVIAPSMVWQARDLFVRTPPRMP